MKVRYAESFLFPSSQLDFKRPDTFYAPQGLHGLGATEAEYASIFPENYAQIVQNRQNLQAQINSARSLPDDDPMKGVYIQMYEGMLQQTYAPGPYWDGIPLAQPKPAPQPTQAELDAAAAKVVAEINAKAEAAAAAEREAETKRQQAAFYEKQQMEAQRAAAAQQAAAADAEAARLQAEANARIADSSRAIQDQAAADRAAAQQAAAQQAAAAADAAAAAAAQQAAAQQAAAAAATGKKITTLALDADANGVYLGAKYSDGSDAVLARGAAAIDAWFKANGLDAGSAQKSAAYVKASATTQTTATDTSSGIVQTKDTSSGTTTTANGSTGVITKTTATGQTVTGTGKLAVDGIITTVDQTTGTVTTENTRTGVVTQTDSSTGKTVTAVQVSGGSNTGGVFMIPDTGKTVTTTTPITGGSDAGKLALLGLLGVLLLRGAVR
jgi:flagellar biosynthesis GTPase FlhF